jgi:hypothetical protein
MLPSYTSALSFLLFFCFQPTFLLAQPSMPTPPVELTPNFKPVIIQQEVVKLQTLEVNLNLSPYIEFSLRDEDNETIGTLLLVPVVGRAGYSLNLANTDTSQCLIMEFNGDTVTLEPSSNRKFPVNLDPKTGNVLVVRVKIKALKLNQMYQC